MTGISIAEPDITLLLDLDGVIRKVTAGRSVSDEGVEAWLGQPWVDTVAEDGGKYVRRMVDDARATGVCAFRQIAQRFPSGRQLPFEYTAVRLGGQDGLLAIGKNLQAVAELESRLIAAQQAMERDYWKLREVETRSRLLFDATSEVVLVIRAADHRIVEANLAAMRALGTAPTGRDLMAEVVERDRASLGAMLARVREHGRAPGVLVHLGPEGHAWLVRASMMAAESGPVFLLQLGSVGAPTPAPDQPEALPLEGLIEQFPEAFVVIDPDGKVLSANLAFLDLVQAGAKASVVGDSLRRWLGRPGADVRVLVANVHRHGAVRRFHTTLQGELGTETEVEIAAAFAGTAQVRHIAVIIRDMRGPSITSGDIVLDSLGKAPLRKLVRDAIGTVERQYIDAALDLTRGNRTAAAGLLGLSRQSLHAKLNRYGDDDATPDLGD
jgi:transcriptional regulator PpsR